MYNDTTFCSTIQKIMTIKPIMIEEITEKANIDFAPAFVHGVLTAYACHDENDRHWAILLQPESELTETQKQAFNELAEIQNHIATQLADSNLSFQLPLNDDDSVSTQSLATRDWASGLWFGLQKNNLLDKMSDEANIEFIRDLKSISAMPLLDEDDKDNLSDLLEIQEYCRMGTIGLFLSTHKNS